MARARKTRKKKQLPVLNASRPSTKAGQPPLLTLPAELKNAIYRMVLVSPDRMSVRSSGLPEPGLLTTCKQIRKEACSIFYLENQFCVMIPNYNPTGLYKWQKRCEALHRRQDISEPMTHEEGEVSPWYPTWPNLLAWLRAVHARTVLFAFRAPSQMPTAAMEILIIGQMFVTVEAMRTLPWDEVLTVLKEQRLVLVRANRAWNEE